MQANTLSSESSRIHRGEISFIAKQDECWVDLSSMHLMKVPVHKIQSFFPMYVIAFCKPKLSYMDANAALLLHFILLTKTHSHTEQMQHFCCTSYC